MAVVFASDLQPAVTLGPRRAPKRSVNAVIHAFQAHPSYRTIPLQPTEIRQENKHCEPVVKLESHPGGGCLAALAHLHRRANHVNMLVTVGHLNYRRAPEDAPALHTHRPSQGRPGKVRTLSSGDGRFFRNGIVGPGVLDRIRNPYQLLKSQD
eukprot:3558123-Rhodomonas_salina.2